MNRVLNDFLAIMKEDLLNGKKVGSGEGYMQMVQTEKFNVNPVFMNAVKRKRRFREMKLGPLDKKVFIQCFIGEETPMKCVRAAQSMRNEMYKKVVSGKQYRPFKNEIRTH
jgi:hypothetical protein